MDANEILPTSIVFVKETGEIYVNGKYYTNHNQTTTNTKDIETIKEQSGWWIEEDTPSFTFGSVESHTKAKADAIVGDICYVGETPIGVVVIKNEDKVKIMSLYWLNKYGEGITDGVGLDWGEPDKTTGIIDENNGKSNTENLVALGEEYEGAIACNLYSTEGTKQGDWYLPAKQEFLDMDWGNNKPKVESSLKNLYSSKNAGFSTLGTYDIQTSTELSSYGLRYIGWNASNRIYDFSKPGNSYVIAFCEL